MENNSYQTGCASLFACAARQQPVEQVTYSVHYLYPEKMWGVFESVTGSCVALFGEDQKSAALDYCKRHNGGK